MKVLRLYEDIGWDEGSRVLVALVDRNGKAKEAFLDKSRIGKLYYICQEERWFDPIKKREVVIARKCDSFLEYQSNNPFYESFWHEIDEKDVSEIRENGLKELLSHPYLKKMKKTSSGRFIVYLDELGRWDDYPMRFSDAIYVLRTNIHPLYGVMD